MTAALGKTSAARMILGSIATGLAAAVVVWLVVFGMLRTHPEEFGASPGLPIRAALIAFLLAAPLSLFYFAVRKYR